MKTHRQITIQKGRISILDMYMHACIYVCVSHVAAVGNSFLQCSELASAPGVLRTYSLYYYYDDAS